ncbi:hypothetical protein Rta_32620 [Ramlibacter tataouinensis TTB310]|uniref:ISXO2-like transposase domain-containing protein n=1 Tax=Ramlibacter tataouinensis (strain ATCC BAA-407 / DSM 14655 / LMG 21543 / TTB310) TaxID=365046 RepID=F5XY49_RAMTT|nr:transposase [Ramlibacter tataouinensis]AEG94374.1 hypothetical protein Rta_32620 [Ramlibacter tataouinensis TTB310]
MRNKRRLQMAAADRANLIRKRKCRSVYVLRELYPEPGKGARRTLVYIATSENEADMMRFAQSYVTPGSIVMTDESNAFTQLSRWFNHRSVVHPREYCSDDGVNDNRPSRTPPR